MEQAALTSFNKPDIYITDADYNALSPLVNGTSATAELLSDEIERAERVKPDEKLTFVKIGSHVQYRDLATDQIKTVQLVLPQDADIDAGRISILTPVGASLIGLTVNARFEWIGNDGRSRELEILSITNPA